MVLGVWAAMLQEWHSAPRYCPVPWQWWSFFSAVSKDARHERTQKVDVLRGPRGLQHARPDGPHSAAASAPDRRLLFLLRRCRPLRLRATRGAEAEAHAPRAGQRQVPRRPLHAERPSQAGRPLPHLETPNSARQHDPAGGAGAQGRHSLQTGSASLDSAGRRGAAARRPSWRSGPCTLGTCTPRSRRRRPPPARRCGAGRPRCRRSSRGGPSAGQRSPPPRRPERAASPRGGVLGGRPARARTRTFWISKSVLSVAPAGCAPAFSDHSAVVASANSISITRFSCGGSIFPQRRMPTMVGRSSTSA